MIPSYIKMFPDSINVFADKVHEHENVLFPLFSVELSYINPEWSGQVHMLQFNEDPYNTGTADTFNEYCKDCMIGFDVVDGKYSFKTDFRYFNLSDDWAACFQKTKDSFHKTRDYFISTRELQNPDGDVVNEVAKIGGEPTWIQTDETPEDPDGTPMTFIAQVYSDNYTNDYCSKNIYLFYSDKHKLAVLLYQIT
ncbi:MAG: hypothetical protein U0Y96_03760 [Candidatus Kapaibacterium sp.]|nr:DUF1963 domain-containing protein [Bacteroidota bacterium]